MLRSILAVLGGYVTLIIGVTAFFAILLFTNPEMRQMDPTAPFDGPAWILWAELGVSGVVALFGGYVAAWIAGRQELAHGAALAGLMLVLGLVSVIGESGSKPLWSSVAVATLPAAVAVLGAALRARVAATP